MFLVGLLLCAGGMIQMQVDLHNRAREQRRMQMGLPAKPDSAEWNDWESTRAEVTELRGVGNTDSERR